MDLKHPFISTPRLISWYSIIWALIITGGLLLRLLAYREPLKMALIDAITMPFLFSILGLSIWYVIRVSSLENSNIVRMVFYHLIAASILIFIWLYLGMVIIKMAHPDANRWMEENLAAHIFAGYMLYLTYVIFFYAIIYYQGFKEKLRNEGNLKSLVKEAELHALKSQINPHFLFNSLNSISSLTMTNPAKAQEMVINLSSLMRYSLKHDQIEKVPFSEELANIKLYLQIEKVRFGNKINAIFNIEDNCLKARLPNMILQPLYENAIKYGVYEAIEPVEIVTNGTFSNNVLEITISNNYDPEVIGKKGEGIGLRNIRDRLQIIYGNPLLMKVMDNKKEFKVTITIPQS